MATFSRLSNIYSKFNQSKAEQCREIFGLPMIANFEARTQMRLQNDFGPFVKTKVIIEKSRGEGSLMEQDTIENVS